jgi:DNA polymerase V
MPLYALVDCNNFFVSCERIFRPDLEGKPVIVLSNNDGCVIARSNESKALGISMGVPFFQIRNLVAKFGIAVFSCNHTLYGDISRRVNETLDRFSDRIEPYSIDESFLDITGHCAPLLTGNDIRRTVRQWTGIPTCVGIGTTKTLAKLANHAAKKMPQFAGVCDLSLPALRQEIFHTTDIADIWGIGAMSAEKLYCAKIRTVAQLAALSSAQARHLLQVQGARIHAELNGAVCFPLDDFPDARQGIAVTRSFGRAVTVMEELGQALAAFASRAAEKLRQDGLEAAHITAFARTSRHGGDAPYSKTLSFDFSTPTDSSFDLNRAVQNMLPHIYRDGVRFAKAGVFLNGLSPRAAHRAIFSPNPAQTHRHP